MRNRVVITVMIEPETVRELREISERLKVPTSILVEQAIKDALFYDDVTIARPEGAVTIASVSIPIELLKEMEKRLKRNERSGFLRYVIKHYIIEKNRVTQ